ncbi:MAG TPA: hypothetical protein VGL57_00680 [Solirubrobacteraceae bacterium]|jgi:hypothetical protein
MFEPELRPGWKVEVEVEDGDSAIDPDSLGGEVMVPEPPAPPEGNEPEPVNEPLPDAPGPLAEPELLDAPVFVAGAGNLEGAERFTKRAERASRWASLAWALAQSLR